MSLQSDFCKNLTEFYQISLKNSLIVHSPTSQPTKQIYFSDVSVLWSDAGTQTKSQVVNQIWLTSNFVVFGINDIN